MVSSYNDSRGVLAQGMTPVPTNYDISGHRRGSWHLAVMIAEECQLPVEPTLKVHVCGWVVELLAIEKWMKTHYSHYRKICIWYKPSRGVWQKNYIQSIWHVLNCWCSNLPAQDLNQRSSQISATHTFELMLEEKWMNECRKESEEKYATY